MRIPEAAGAGLTKVPGDSEWLQGQGPCLRSQLLVRVPAVTWNKSLTALCLSLPYVKWGCW